jgi:hypothetical protein
MKCNWLRAQVRASLAKDEEWIQQYIVKVRNMWDFQSKYFVFRLFTSKESVVMVPVTSSLVVPQPGGVYELTTGISLTEEGAAQGKSTLVGKYSISPRLTAKGNGKLSLENHKKWPCGTTLLLTMSFLACKKRKAPSTPRCSSLHNFHPSNKEKVHKICFIGELNLVEEC